MKRSDEGESLDPDVERELEAIDRALAGREVEADMEPVATLVAELRAERPEPDASWAAELDDRAAAGFGGGARSPLSAQLGRFRIRNLLLPAAGLATLVIVAVVGVGVTVDRSGNGGTLTQLQGDSAGNSSSSGSSLPVPTTPQSSAGEGGNGTRYLDPFSGSSDSSALPAPTLKGAQKATTQRALKHLQPLTRSAEGFASKTAPGTSKRREDRSASLTLRTGTDEVPDISDQAIQITESVGGVVTSSQLSQTRSTATAQLELSIPTRDLDSTLDRLTNLATVASLNEASTDITHPFVSAQQQLRDARAQRAKLLEALGNASTDAEAQSIRKQLDDLRKKIARKKAAFAKVARQARMADVSLRIEGSDAAGASGGDGSNLGNAASDALDALTTVAGVMLVGAAIVVPILALVALIWWLAVLARRRSRERALDA